MLNLCARKCKVWIKKYSGTAAGDSDKTLDKGMVPAYNMKTKTIFIL